MSADPDTTNISYNPPGFMFDNVVFGEKSLPCPKTSLGRLVFPEKSLCFETD